jgi:hypothetical protein
VARLGSKQREFENISVLTNVLQTNNNRTVFQSEYKRNEIMLHYPPHSHTSYGHPLFRSTLNNASDLRANLTVDFYSRFVHVILFEWSLNNPANPVFLRFAFYCFLIAGGMLFFCLGFTYQRRIEQIGTLISLWLFCLSSLNLICSSVIFQVIEKLMSAQLRMALFYSISFIANKDKDLLTKIGFACLIFSLLFDIACCIHPWNRTLDLMHGHGIAFHFSCFAVIGSMIAAMKLTTDHQFSYTAYSILIVLNFVGTILTRDLCLVFPYFDHWFEPQTAFYGIQLVIVTMLFYLHQGVSGTDSDGDKLSDPSSDDEQVLI